MTDNTPDAHAAFKQLFSHPRMVRDLLDGFVARGWCDALDLETLTALPARYVGPDLRQRYADFVWRVRFRDGRWLYVVIEIPSNVDRWMAVRMLTYTGLLYRRLIKEGVLREHGALPPVLPIVIYNGRTPWTAPTDLADLFEKTDVAALARYRPSLRYFLVDVEALGREMRERSLLCRQAARKFDAAAAGRLADALAGIDDPARLAQVGEWIIECETAADLIARVLDTDNAGD
ncbi:MAG: Rpn family recombination-promoting nuclease/putative transposase [Acidobacteria bacterium]|nr:Rpn family recombination-promoting nuclease/putative transposase [Acidobacteriota bacterium]